MIADDRAWRETHQEQTWSSPCISRSANRPDPHQVRDDRVFAAFGILVNVAGALGALYFVVRFAMAFLQ